MAKYLRKNLGRGKPGKRIEEALEKLAEFE